MDSSIPRDRLLTSGGGLLLLACLIALLLSPSAVAQDSLQTVDSASVKIMVDVDSVQITVNGELLAVDSYGNPLSAKAWFLLVIPVGSYHIEFSHSRYPGQSRTFELGEGQIESIEIMMAPAPPEVEMPAVSVPLFISSDPESLLVYLDQNQLSLATPTELSVPIGEHAVELYADGYEPLSHSFRLTMDTALSLRFMMRTLAPPEVPPESLGMARMRQMPLIDEALADRQMATYSSLAETFLIIPLGQGLLGKALLSKDDQKTANALVISGVILSGGSYLLGKILSGRKKAWIRRENERITLDNQLAKDNNAQVDRAIREYNELQVETWLSETEGRGIVEATTTPQ